MAKLHRIREIWSFFVEEILPSLMRGVRMSLPVLVTGLGAFIVFKPQITEYMHGLDSGQQYRFFLALTIGIVSILFVLSNLSRRVFLDYDSDYSDYSQGAINRLLARAEERVSKRPPLSAIEQYAELSSSSRSLAASLYNRSGVYLVTGVFLAVGGITTFYFMRPKVVAGSPALDLVVALLPGSSTLLLVELIAFFFLRQSRAAMDEFRHFDQLARTREEVLAALRLSADAGRPLDIAGLMEKGFYFSRGERLSSGETTEIVETRKLEKTEVDLLKNIVDLISSKKN